MVKSVVIYGNHARMHSFLKTSMANPPNGYKFVLSESQIKKDLLIFMLNSRLIKFIYKNFIKGIFPTKSFYNFLSTSKIPDSSSLIFSGQVLNISRPWVLEILDHPACLEGYNYNAFLKNLKIIEKKLLSPFCKLIIITNESSLKLMKKYFSSKVIKKCVLLRAGVIPENYKKTSNNKEINIIFIGSLANPDDFYIKGGLEALESFKIVSEKFPNSRFFFRCIIPKDIKRRYENITNLYFLDKELDSKQWKNLLKNADICLNPGHVYPLMAILESLNNCLPIIMLDTWGVRDYLTNNYNSILINPSKKIMGYRDLSYPLNIRTKEFIAEIKSPDSRVIRDICSALLKLIGNKNLREKLGRNGKKTILERFNLNKRNQVLEKIFNSALKN